MVNNLNFLIIGDRVRKNSFFCWMEYGVAVLKIGFGYFLPGPALVKMGVGVFSK